MKTNNNSFNIFKQHWIYFSINFVISRTCSPCRNPQRRMSSEELHERSSQFQHCITSCESHGIPTTEIPLPMSHLNLSSPIPDVSSLPLKEEQDHLVGRFRHQSPPPMRLQLRRRTAAADTPTRNVTPGRKRLFDWFHRQEPKINCCTGAHASLEINDYWTRTPHAIMQSCNHANHHINHLILTRIMFIFSAIWFSAIYLVPCIFSVIY